MRILSIKNAVASVKFYSTKTTNKSKYSNTVLLPQTKFPLRLDNQKLIDRDEKINNINKSLYKWQRENLSGPEFVLHDGPPYANGAPHMGHSINKILKDIVVRMKILQGRKVHYVPGWDCHGLPIELKAIGDMKEKLSPLQIRQKARNFAKQTIQKQKAAFTSWGVIGDWENAYTTFNQDYIINQIREFYKLYEKKLIYRDVKPVYWSPSSKTALAEAELEYNSEHKSIATTIKFKALKLPDALAKYENVYVLIWTTTPWTIPSNQAVCYNNDLSYSLVQKSATSEKYIIASDLVESHQKMFNTPLEVLETFSGYILNGTLYEHPIYKTELPLLYASHATASKGTGLVHTAPAHGPDDFLVALNNNIPIKCIVDESGAYTPEAGDTFNSLSVLTEGTQKVLETIKENILHVEDFIHSYPYDWRTKKPVILRASKQWFIDTKAIKTRAAELLEDVSIVPKINEEKYKRTLIGQVMKRPYWCISRQRIWGVPIPVFYDKSTGEHIINSEIIENVCSLLEKSGPDYWWKLPIEELIPQQIIDKLKLSYKEIEKGEDILDIWFDSGMSWSSVLKGDKVADLYLEGVDQFNGWFQSSLTASVALRDQTPYKSIYVHGFALDENGLKMSKSLGNVVDPQDILRGAKGQKPYGIDTLRWWVANHANHDSTAHISKNVLQVCADDVQKIRSVLRFTLGALSDYKSINIEYNSMRLIDKYVLHLLYNYNKQMGEFLDEYEFHKVCRNTLNLATNELSALYFTAIKDRLYCDASDSFNRQSAQFVLYQVFSTLALRLACIVPHLVEELYLHLPQKSAESFFEDKCRQLPEIWENSEIETLMEVITNIKRELNVLIGSKTIEQNVTITVSNKLADQLRIIHSPNQELCDIFQVANVEICMDAKQEELFTLATNKSGKFSCNRCRRIAADVEDELCIRCVTVVDESNNKESVTN